MQVSFTVLGEPKGKARPRFAKGHAMTPKDTANYETLVHMEYADARQVDEEEVKGIPMLESADKAAESEPEVVDVECEETQVEDDSNGADGDIEAGEESDYEYD